MFVQIYAAVSDRTLNVASFLLALSPRSAEADDAMECTLFGLEAQSREAESTGSISENGKPETKQSSLELGSADGDDAKQAAIASSYYSNWPDVVQPTNTIKEGHTSGGRQGVKPWGSGMECSYPRKVEM